MKNNNCLLASKFTTLLLIGLSSITMYQCKSFKGATATSKPNPLEVHADSIKFTVSANIPPKSGFHKKKGLFVGKLTIKKSGGNNYDLGSITVRGADYPDIKNNGATITHTSSTPYNDGMDGGMLTSINSYQKGKKVNPLPDIELAPCCITTSRLICSGAGDSSGLSAKGLAQFALSKYAYQTSKPVDLNAVFQFPQNVFALQAQEYEKQEIKTIGEFLTKKYKASKITIEGFASPEGSFRRNQYLSVQRSKEVQKWLVEQLKNNGYTQYLDSAFFEISTTSEDWEGFKEKLNSTTYSDDIKKQIIQIVSAGYEEDVKEQRVMKLVGGAKQVEDILSPLRRARIKLKGDESTHTNDQIKDALNKFLNGKTNTDSLKAFFKEDEMLYGIAMFNKREEKIKFLTEFNKLFSKDHRGYNDIGVYYALNGDTTNAITNLKTANDTKPNDFVILNNLGGAYLVAGNTSEAIKYFQSSLDAKFTPQTAYNLGVIYLKKAQYVEASEMFDKVQSEIPCAKYNGGLSKLLMKEWAGSKTDLEGYIRMYKDNALSYYLLAILGAQTKDVNLLTLNLIKSIQLDKTLSAKASKDLEFREFTTNDAFKAALKTK